MHQKICTRSQHSLLGRTCGANALPLPFYKYAFTKLFELGKFNYASCNYYLIQVGGTAHVSRTAALYLAAGDVDYGDENDCTRWLLCRFVQLDF